MDSNEEISNSSGSANHASDSSLTARSSEVAKSTGSYNDIGSVKSLYVHRNGDVYSTARRVVYNKKQLRTWDVFLEELTSTLKPRTGPVRDIYTPKTGTKVESFEDILPNTNYVAVAAGEKLQMIGYLDLLQEQEAAKKRRNYNMSQSATDSTPPSIVNRKPQISGRIKYEMQKRGKNILIFRNGDEYTRAIAVLLKHFEQKSLDLVLKAVGEKVILPTSLPIRRLFTMDGEPIGDVDQLEDNTSYVASGQEAFIPCLYGQALPNIVCGSKKAERIRYLNSVATPMPGKQRNKVKSNPTDSDSPRTSRQITNESKVQKNKMEKPITRSIKSISKDKPDDKVNNNKPTLTSRDYSPNQTTTKDNNKASSRKSMNSTTAPRPVQETPINGNDQSDTERRQKSPPINKGKPPKEDYSSKAYDPIGNGVNNDPDLYSETVPDEYNHRDRGTEHLIERETDNEEDNMDDNDLQDEYYEKNDDEVQHSAAVIQASYRGYQQRTNNVID